MESRIIKIPHRGGGTSDAQNWWLMGLSRNVKIYATCQWQSITERVKSGARLTYNGLVSNPRNILEADITDGVMSLTLL